MRFPSRRDHDLFELTTALCTKFAQDDAWDQWRELVAQGGQLDEVFPLQYKSRPNHGGRRCIEVTAIELILMCWPWQRLSEGLKTVAAQQPLEDVVFSRLSALAMNNTNEWGHIHHPRSDEQTVEHHVMYALSRWCSKCERKDPTFLPKMGWWEVLALREKNDFDHTNALSIIEGLVQSLPPLSSQGVKDNLLHAQWCMSMPDYSTYGCPFGSLLVGLIHKPDSETQPLYDLFKTQIFSNTTNERVNEDVLNLINAEELAERARVAHGIDTTMQPHSTKRKM